MKRFMSKKLLVVGVAVAVVLGVGGAAFAYFTTTGSGTGNAYVGTGATLSINQLTPTSSVLYDSMVSPLPGEHAELRIRKRTRSTRFGNEVNLASSGQTLSNVRRDDGELDMWRLADRLGRLHHDARIELRGPDHVSTSSTSGQAVVR